MGQCQITWHHSPEPSPRKFSKVPRLPQRRRSSSLTRRPQVLGAHSTNYSRHAAATSRPHSISNNEPPSARARFSLSGRFPVSGISVGVFSMLLWYRQCTTSGYRAEDGGRGSSVFIFSGFSRARERVSSRLDARLYRFVCPSPQSEEL